MVKPKGSIANGCVIEEDLGFCTKYIQGNEIHEEGMGWWGAYHEWWKEGMATLLIWMSFSKAHTFFLHNASMTNLGANGSSSWF